MLKVLFYLRLFDIGQKILPIQDKLTQQQTIFIGLQDMQLALIHSFATFIAVSSQTIIPL